MWLVVAENSADRAASHFECFFHIDDQPPKPDSKDALKSSIPPLSSLIMGFLTLFGVS
jgi:hypothetical protein